MTGYSIYESPGGAVQAVKVGFRWLPFVFGYRIPWAIRVGLWWLAALDIVGVAGLIIAVLVTGDPDAVRRFVMIYFGALAISYFVAFFKAEEWEANRLEKSGYEFADYFEAYSGEHAIALYLERKYDE